MVSLLSVLIRVLETKLDPGSLKAMWPSGPIPKNKQKIWWKLLIIYKYFWFGSKKLHQPFCDISLLKRYIYSNIEFQHISNWPIQSRLIYQTVVSFDKLFKLLSQICVGQNISLVYIINLHYKCHVLFNINSIKTYFQGRRGRVQSVPITTKVVSFNPTHGDVYFIQHYMIKFVSDLRPVSSFLLWLSLGTQVSSTNRTDSHDITEILLKVVLNTIPLTVKKYFQRFCNTDAIFKMINVCFSFRYSK